MTKPVKRAGSKPGKPFDNWIRVELKRLFGKADLQRGVDLNGDGKIKGPKEEIANYNNNNIPGYKKNQKNPYKKITGDWTDWLAFYRANHKLIAAKARKNRNSIFYWAAKFKSTNRIHIVTTIESALVKRKKVMSGYKKLWKIVSLARRYRKSKTAWNKLDAVEGAMRRSGIAFKNQDDALFLDNLSNNQLDCDTSSFVLLAEADEQGWPLYLVNVPDHTFVRWDNNKKGSGRVRFNFGAVGNYNEEDFRKTISAVALRQKVYLESLNLAGFVSHILSNRGTELHTRGRYQEAIMDLSRAIALDPNYVTTIYNRGVTYAAFRMFDKALRDLNAVRKLDPKYDYPNISRVAAWMKLRAKLSLNPQIRFNPSKGRSIDSRTALNFTVSPFRFGPLGLGASLEMGYGVGVGHHILDLLGSVSLEGKFRGSSFSLEVGAGYNFFVSGNDDNAPVAKGGFFKYGLKYRKMFGHFGLSAYVYAQHQFDDSKRPAIVTGLGFVWDMRGIPTY